MSRSGSEFFSKVGLHAEIGARPDPPESPADPLVSHAGSGREIAHRFPHPLSRAGFFQTRYLHNIIVGTRPAVNADLSHFSHELSPIWS